MAAMFNTSGMVAPVWPVRVLPDVYACMYMYICMYVCMYVCMHVTLYYVNMILEQKMDTLLNCSPSSATYVCMYDVLYVYLCMYVLRKYDSMCVCMCRMIVHAFKNISTSDIWDMYVCMYVCIYVCRTMNNKCM